MTTKLLSIGMEKSCAGNCSGAEKDATRMFNFIKSECNSSKLLLNGEATKENVLKELQNVCDSDLAIIFYAGHGDSRKVKSNAPEEADGKDEMIFLADKYLLDDEIWNVVSKAKGRVFMIFDCCHSETMFRVAPPPQSKNLLFAASSSMPDLLCWSGCADNKTSLGSLNGGLFTNTILANAKMKLTYEENWKKISGDTGLASKEIVKQTMLKTDSGFKNRMLFS